MLRKLVEQRLDLLEVGDVGASMYQSYNAACPARFALLTGDYRHWRRGVIHAH